MTETDDRSFDVASATAVSEEAEQELFACDPKALCDEIVAALRTVHDPEIPVNIYDLGLVYRIDVTKFGFVQIDMTLTAPGCPVAGDIVMNVQNVVSLVPGVMAVSVKLVFDPPWDQSKMSEEAKLELGFV